MENKQQVQESTKAYFRYQTLINLFMFALCSLFFYNFIKALLADVGTFMEQSYLLMPIILTYLLPVIHFIGFFISNYVKKTKLPGRITFLVISTILIIYNLVGIGMNYNVYVSNNTVGVYESLPSIWFLFPYDALAINLFLITFNIFNVYLLIKPGSKLSYIKDSFHYEGYFKYSKYGIIGVVVSSLFAFYFLGTFASGLYSLQSVATSNGLYFFLLIYLLVPTMNFVYILINPSIRDLKTKTKVIQYSIGIGINLLMVLLFIIFEAIAPTFVMEHSMGLFPADHMASFPFGPYILIISSIVFSIIYMFRMIKDIKKSKELVK